MPDEGFEPIIVNDGLENWCLRPEDNMYLLALKVEPDEKGIRHVSTDITEGMHTWWWRQAIEKAEKLIEELAIPWETLAINDLDITDGNLMALSEKLAKTSFYIVQVNNKLSRLLAVQSAAKDTLDHSVNRILSRDMDSKGTVAVRTASAISRDKRLRNMKIELIESNAIVKALETINESLELLWKTTSRILSCRMYEPAE